MKAIEFQLNTTPRAAKVLTKCGFVKLASFNNNCIPPTVANITTLIHLLTPRNSIIFSRFNYPFSFIVGDFHEFLGKCDNRSGTKKVRP